MSTLEALKKHGPCEAFRLAHIVAKPLEVVYAELVAAEARHMARVVVSQPRKSIPKCSWEAM